MSLWAIGRYDFGLTDPEFWTLSWRQFVALGKRAAARIRIDDHRAGVIAATLVNLQRRKPPWATPGDFFDLGELAKARVMTPEQMKHVAAIANAAMGGRDLRLVAGA